MAAELCFLCEDPIDIKFEPCGHAVMCSACAQRTRKCPICKVRIKSKSIENPSFIVNLPCTLKASHLVSYSSFSLESRLPQMYE